MAVLSYTVNYIKKVFLGFYRKAEKVDLHSDGVGGVDG